MPKPKRGEVWLVRFPFTDLTPAKLRPALIWATHGEDIIIMGIFSRVYVGALHETWVLISERHPKFSQIGLKKDSLLKAEKIAVVHESILQRKLGVLPRDIMAQVEKALKMALLLT